MTQEQINIQKALEASRDQGNFPDVFPIGFGADIKLKTKPEYKISVCEPRTAIIRITTYRGICGWASHYYASIEAEGISFQEEKDGHIITHGGYICEEYSELCKNLGYIPDSLYRIDIVRSLTQQDIDSDPIRWEGYYVGDKVNAFYKAQDAINTAMNVVKVRFPDWTVKIEKL